MDGQSLNPQEEKLKQLQSILPEAFTEGKVDWEKLKATLGEDISFTNERYLLNWAGKSEAFKVLQIPSTKTLEPIREQSIDFDNTSNIFIEGENMEVLKILQKSYFNKIKLIYIDPPYNTGNDSFIYPDNFSESKGDYQKRVGDKDEEGFMTKQGMFHKNSKENGQYHSNWLNMMYPRLFLAKNLLKHDGVIFVSIDDNEVHNLRLIMNEVFGEENFVANIIWEKKFAPSNDAKWFSDTHDHILVYAKNKQDWSPNLLDRSEEAIKRYKNPDKDERGPWVSGDLTVKTYNAKYDFEIVTPSGKKINPPEGICWRFSKERIAELRDDNRIWFGNDGNNVPRLKRFLSEVKSGVTPMTIWKHKDVGHNQEAFQEVRKLFDGKQFFSTPKPIRLLNQIIKIGMNKDDIVLDFFAGSASTAQAVMEMNLVDKGDRKFICIQLPEPCDEKSDAYVEGYHNIADIGKERIRRAINKLKNENKGYNGDLGFKVLKLNQSNFKQWLQSGNLENMALEEQMELFVDPVSESAKFDNMAYELMIKSGKDINSKLESNGEYFMVNDDELIFFLEKISQNAIEDVIKVKPGKVIALDRLFKNNDQLKTNTSLQMKDAGIEFNTI